MLRFNNSSNLLGKFQGSLRYMETAEILQRYGPDSNEQTHEILQRSTRTFIKLERDEISYAGDRLQVGACIKNEHSLFIFTYGNGICMLLVSSGGGRIALLHGRTDGQI